MSAAIGSTTSDLRTPVLREGDVGEATARELRAAGRIAWDIETSGLDWSSDKIGTCQLYSDATGAIVIQLNGHVPSRLCEILRDAQVTKAFHHAMFDLRFMRAQWGIQARSVRCTKVASKIIDPELPAEEHSLQRLLSRMDISISKDARLSDWLGEHLSAEQVAYAANDVRYLLPLLSRLEQTARERGLFDVLDRCFNHLPTRVELDVRGYGDIYQY
jgi:ribonuclease D